MSENYQTLEFHNTFTKNIYQTHNSTCQSSSLEILQEILMQTAVRRYFQTDIGMRVNIRTVMMMVLE